MAKRIEERLKHRSAGHRASAEQEAFFRFDDGLEADLELINKLDGHVSFTVRSGFLFRCHSLVTQLLNLLPASPGLLASKTVCTMASHCSFVSEADLVEDPSPKTTTMFPFWSWAYWMYSVFTVYSPI
jgi:hypothetical protein